ncbi:hypothetical protein H5V45_11880 [Nocardioides sp. KIGAM211]|uniref:Mycothiol-dependent maleylpyruvate isomerase metal-binding domain-containing protein n=1 Tax=Nocardioides luti TaxID=2761101 RepID=A0A7X0VBI7_9ACTN|nr:maleylpyruvate isomerase N-terminal domain-containing protein [Nocardioides luti]MBB6628017.1 hypothetical protein [Nocardioides luti]
MTDWAQLYRDHVDAVAALATGLDEPTLATRVAGTPEWTVREVVAHLAGGPADSLTGRTEGAPGPEWTARHVAERAGRDVGELVAELRANTEATAASTVDNPRPAVVWDIAVHHADLHEALGRHRLPEHLWAPVLAAVAPGLLARAPAEVVCGGETWGAGGPRVEVAPYELFRGVFSRRSRAQMQAWGGPVLEPDHLDGLCIFGPRDDDQPLPG